MNDNVLEAIIACNYNRCIPYWRKCPKCRDKSVHLFCNAKYYYDHKHIIICMNDSSDFEKRFYPPGSVCFYYYVNV